MQLDSISYYFSDERYLYHVHWLWNSKTNDYAGTVFVENDGWQPIGEGSALKEPNMIGSLEILSLILKS